MLISTLVAYAGSLKYGFSQDDWYFLSISVAHSFREVVNFFNPWNQAGFAFYRPLGTQLYYYLARLFWGLQGAPLGMHIVMLLIQSLSAHNVYRLVRTMTRDVRLALLIGVVYAGASTHFLSLYYIAATQQLLAALFALLAINNYLEQKNIRSALYFALALLSKEVAIVTPGIMILASQRIQGQKLLNLPKMIRSLIPLGIVGLGYVGIRLLGGVHVQSEYHLVLNGSVVSTLRWYYLFGFGAPEVMVNYGLPRMFVNVYRFIQDFTWQGFVTASVSLGLGVYVLIRAVIGLWRKTGLTPLAVGIYFTWWLVGIAPVLFLQDHRYPHYVDLSLIPMMLLVLENQTKKAQVFFATILIGVSLISINLSQSSHWTTKRSDMSSRAQTAIIDRGACKHDSWTVTGSGDSPLQLSYALSLSNGPRVICSRNLEVYYQGMPASAPAGSFIFSTTGIVNP